MKKKESDLKENLLLLDFLLTNINYMVITTSKDGIITSFNQKAEAVLGYQASELIGIHTPAIIHYLPEVVERAAQFSKELGIILQPGFNVFVAKTNLNLPNEYEWNYVTKEGEHIPVSLSVTALYDKDGSIIGYVGIARDISEEKKTFAQLLHSKQLLNDAQHLTKVGSWSLDLIQNHLEWSDEIYNIFEIDPDRFYPSYEGFLNAIHPQDVEIVQEAFSKSVERHPIPSPIVF